MTGSPADLFNAAASGDIKQVRRLLATGIPAVAKGPHGLTAMHAAAMAGHDKIVRTLLNNKAPIDIKSADGCTPLMKAAEAGQGEVVCELLDGGAEPNISTPKHMTALLYAADHGHAGVISALLSAGADASFRQPPTGLTAMHLAIEKGHDEAVEALLHGGVDPNGPAPDGMNLLDYASKHGQGAIITVLCENGASVRATDNRGNTCLHKLVQSWRDSKPLANGRTDGRTEQYLGALKVLLEAGADPWQINHAGKTALNLATDRGNTRATQLMIEAVPNPRSAAGRARKSLQPRLPAINVPKMEGVWREEVVNGQVVTCGDPADSPDSSPHAPAKPATPRRVCIQLPSVDLAAHQPALSPIATHPPQAVQIGGMATNTVSPFTAAAATPARPAAGGISSFQGSGPTFSTPRRSVDVSARQSSTFLAATPRAGSSTKTPQVSGLLNHSNRSRNLDNRSRNLDARQASGMLSGRLTGRVPKAARQSLDLGSLGPRQASGRLPRGGASMVLPSRVSTDLGNSSARDGGARRNSSAYNRLLQPTASSNLRAVNPSEEPSSQPEQPRSKRACGCAKHRRLGPSTPDGTPVLSPSAEEEHSGSCDHGVPDAASRTSSTGSAAAPVEEAQSEDAAVEEEAESKEEGAEPEVLGEEVASPVEEKLEDIPEKECEEEAKAKVKAGCGCTIM